MAYVLVGLKRERCRAKNPSKCRYHVGPDGKPMKHYPDAWSADKALESLKERLTNGPRGLEAPEDQEAVDLSRLMEDQFYPDSRDAVPMTDDDDGHDGSDGEDLDSTEGVLFQPMDEDPVDGHTDGEEHDSESPTDAEYDNGDHGSSTGDDDLCTDVDGVGLEDGSLMGKIRRTRLEKMEDVHWSEDGQITPGVVQSLNRARARSSMIHASSQAASNMVMLTLKGLREDGRARLELMWGFEDSPALWPELWSTRTNDPYRELTLKDYTTVDRVDVRLKRRVYLDPTSAEESWSHDVVDGGGIFSSEDLHYEAGLYDAVRDGFLKWEDLRGIGAVSCLMTAVESVGTRRDGSPFLKTVNVWCGRKPKSDVYVEGDEDVNGGKAFKRLDDMMESFEMMVAGMTQATVTLTVVGSEPKPSSHEAHGEEMGNRGYEEE